MATVPEPIRAQAKARPAAFPVDAIRGDFPALHQEVNGNPLAYLDNAATTQKPQAVIDAITHFYAYDNANVHRGVHTLSQRATDAFEETRKKLKRFINAPLACELVYVRGATEGINLVAQSYARPRLKPGDEVLITGLEHHANIVPWQILCEQTGAVLKVAPITDKGELDLDAYKALLSERTKLVGAVHVSNALGTINPAKEVCDLAREAGAVSVLDGAQSVPHLPIDVQGLGCDFFVLSGHKMCGPTGIGALWGRAELLEAMPPYQAGGDMILSVTFEKTRYNTLPHKFEAGTPHIAGVIGLGAAIDYLEGVGMEAVAAYEHELLAYGAKTLAGVEGLRVIGEADSKAGVLSFIMDHAHPHDIGQILDEHGVAVRAGHHCAQPVMKRFGVPATTRASLAFYNTYDEIDRLGQALQAVNEVFA